MMFIKTPEAEQKAERQRLEQEYLHLWYLRFHAWPLVNQELWRGRWNQYLNDVNNFIKTAK